MAKIIVIALLIVIAFIVHFASARHLGHHPSGHGHHGDGHGHHRPAGAVPLYVFGDTFADTGNLPRRDDRWPALARQWHFPYGGSGRFSNENVEPDFLAAMLGHTHSPPAHAVAAHAGVKSGVNFAAGGSGVFEVPQGVPTLGMQVEAFDDLVRAGTVHEGLLRASSSVALVAVSGLDYDRVSAGTTAFADLERLVERVTDEVVANTVRLQEIGLRRILVNNLPPLGCAPSLTRATNYTACDELANNVAALHNRRLAEKLAAVDSALLLDVSKAFATIVKHHGDGGGEVARRFLHKLRPCCESANPGAYCGQRSANGTADLYTLCDDPEDFFFWDESSPTQAGWAAVMEQFKAPILEFLLIDE